MTVLQSDHMGGITASETKQETRFYVYGEDVQLKK